MLFGDYGKVLTYLFLASPINILSASMRSTANFLSSPAASRRALASCRNSEYSFAASVTINCLASVLSSGVHFSDATNENEVETEDVEERGLLLVF